ncbi:hypothetical protein JOY44_21135 [Phormidium sp. CLA17]|uniref:hypothetical protein n=1 Tax=Leptolyngbya sp. Cla-17 TaxID=2803751 RepID=UPI001492DC9D|nr:hypothetical protein [Leptolyngbya sp. Cla-17]MBM0744092.1 hypothetical protein [Leptolyngbya sp. Cla-17]
MQGLDPLQAKREALQEQYSLLSEKRLELGRSSAIAADPSMQFQLKKQIEQVDSELEALEQRLVQLDRLSQDGRLYQALLKLGYRKQVQVFRKFVQSHPIATFLIYGASDYGQRWLLNRLVQQHTRDSITGKVVKINLSRIARRSDVAALWRELAGRAGLSRQGTIAEIVDRVYQWWQTQNVLLILYDIDCLPQDFLAELLRDFWMPLAVRAWAEGTPESAYKLLMFLVDYDGCVGNWTIPFAEQLDDTWQPVMPVKLPLIGEFTESELLNWLEVFADDLSMALLDEPDETVQVILENSDRGIPEPTLDEICRQAGSNWYDNEEKWLKL